MARQEAPAIAHLEGIQQRVLLKSSQLLILKKVPKQMQKHIGNLFFVFSFDHEVLVYASCHHFFTSVSVDFNVVYFVIVMLIYGNRSFDESTWGAFDNNDDVDSVWGFNTKVTCVILSFSLGLGSNNLISCSY
jgi:hypothetical protein